MLRRSDPDDGLRALLRGRLPHVGQWVTIETGLVEQGVPDSNVIARLSGRETWIECKATDAWAVTLRPAQIGWIFTRARYGGNVIIAVRRRSRKPRKRVAPYDELRVVDGQYVRELSTEGLRGVPQMLVTGGGPGRWDWKKLEEILT